MTTREQCDKQVATALQKVGLNVSSVYDLVNSKAAYAEAMPTLLKCLIEIDEPVVKEGIVRALTVKEARGIAEDALLGEFEKIQPQEPPNLQLLKWAIGNALSVVATDKSFERIVELLHDRQHGKSREMLAIALGNMKNPRAMGVLIELLNDDEVAGHALKALGKLKVQKARPQIERFLKHEKPWVRREASQALIKIES